MLNDTLQGSKKNDNVITVLITSVFILAVVGVVALFFIMSTQIKTSEKVATEVSQQLAYNVHNRIIADLQVLQMISGSIAEDFKNFKPNDLRPFLLKTEGRQASFNSFSFITLAGQGYTVVKDNPKISTANMYKMPCFISAKSGLPPSVRSREKK